MRATERSITMALKKRYKNHIFADQVKLGAAGSKIMDAVAIEKTWSPITVVGFEIKTSRQDFLNDNKYPEYMKNCTNFYFVVPKGIIEKNEIPPNVGLIIYNPKTNTLRTKKKAPYLNNEVGYKMLLHVMFWKMGEYERPITKAEHFENVKTSIESKDYSTMISRKISELEKTIEHQERTISYKIEENNGFKKKFKEKTGIGIWKIDQVLQYINKDAAINNQTEEVYRNITKAYSLIPEKYKMEDK